jgi:small-conductance mechanosensitive channel
MANDKNKPNIGFRKSVINLILWIALYLIISALINSVIPIYYKEFNIYVLTPYGSYINIVLALVFGYMIVISFSNVVYWSLRLRYPYSTAQAVKSIFTIIGIGALLASIAGAIAGGAAGVALAGFIGLVIGFASQQVLGQAIAGLFVLLARPVRIGDYATLAGETGTIEDISSMFTMVRKDDGVLVLIPNNMLIGSKIQIIKRGS